MTTKPPPEQDDDPGEYTQRIEIMLDEVGKEADKLSDAAEGLADKARKAVRESLKSIMPPKPEPEDSDLFEEDTKPSRPSPKKAK